MIRPDFLTRGITIVAVAFATLTGATSTVAAGHGNWLGRKLGLGWSDGYHARSPYVEDGVWGSAPMRPQPAPPLVPPAAPPREVIQPPRTTTRPQELRLPSEMQTPRPVYWHR